MTTFMTLKKMFMGYFIVLFLQLIRLNTFIVSAQPSFSSVEERLKVPLQAFMDQFGVLLNIFMGFVLITNIIIFIYHFSKLAMSASNPKERSEAIEHILISGVCLALTGATNLIVWLLFLTVMK